MVINRKKDPQLVQVKKVRIWKKVQKESKKHIIRKKQKERISVE